MNKNLQKYKTVIRERKDKISIKKLRKCKEENLIGKDGKVIERWQEYFSDVLNSGTEEENKEITMRTIRPIEEPTKEEVIINNLKKYKQKPRKNAITPENMKYVEQIAKD